MLVLGSVGRNPWNLQFNIKNHRALALTHAFHSRSLAP